MGSTLLSKYLSRLPYYVDKLSPLKGGLARDGFVSIPADEISEEILKACEVQMSDARKNLLNSDETSNLIEKSDVSLSLLNEFVARIERDYDNIFTRYLGRFQVDVSYIFIDYFSSKIHRNSQIWHHDSVGHRVKIFLSPDEVSTAPTEVVPDTHRITHIMDPSWNKSERLDYTPNDTPVKFETKKGIINIIDTNCIHRGSVGVPGSFRNILVVELSHPLKSLCRGRVGRRKYP
jgi:hypothetical protein